MNVKLFFLMSLIQASAVLAMNTPANGNVPALDNVAQLENALKQKKNVSLDDRIQDVHDRASSFFPCETPQERIKTFGQAGIAATGLGLLATDNYMAGLLVLSCATCAKFPDAVNNGIEKSKPYIQEINRENCSRGAQRCKQLTSWLSFGLYKPTPNGKQKKLQ